VICIYGSYITEIKRLEFVDFWSIKLTFSVKAPVLTCSTLNDAIGRSVTNVSRNGQRKILPNRLNLAAALEVPAA
jgi:hypothetical protein